MTIQEICSLPKNHTGLSILIWPLFLCKSVQFGPPGQVSSGARHMESRNQAVFSNLSSTLQGHSLVLWPLSHTGLLVCANPSAKLMLWGHSRKPCHLWRSPLVLLALTDTENGIPPSGSSGVTLEEEEVWWSWSEALWRCSPRTNWDQCVNFNFFLALKNGNIFLGRLDWGSASLCQSSYTCSLFLRHLP